MSTSYQKRHFTIVYCLSSPKERRIQEPQYIPTHRNNREGKGNNRKKYESDDSGSHVSLRVQGNIREPWPPMSGGESRQPRTPDTDGPSDLNTPGDRTHGGTTYPEKPKIPRSRRYNGTVYLAPSLPTHGRGWLRGRGNRGKNRCTNDRHGVITVYNGTWRYGTSNVDRKGKTRTTKSKKPNKLNRIETHRNLPFSEGPWSE